jgi:hypothetical protein
VLLCDWVNRTSDFVADWGLFPVSYEQVRIILPRIFNNFSSKVGISELSISHDCSTVWRNLTENICLGRFSSLPPTLLSADKNPNNMLIHGFVLKALHSCGVCATLLTRVKLHHSDVLVALRVEQYKLLNPWIVVWWRFSWASPALIEMFLRKLMLPQRSSFMS